MSVLLFLCGFANKMLRVLVLFEKRTYICHTKKERNLIARELTRFIKENCYGIIIIRSKQRLSLRRRIR